MKSKSYRELIVWQKAMDLAVAVHPVALSFPKVEMFGLTSQLNRAAVSVPSNIAEGQGRRTTGDFIHFLGIAKSSLNMYISTLPSRRRAISRPTTGSER